VEQGDPLPYGSVVGSAATQPPSGHRPVEDLTSTAASPRLPCEARRDEPWTLRPQGVRSAPPPAVRFARLPVRILAPHCPPLTRLHEKAPITEVMGANCVVGLGGCL